MDTTAQGLLDLYSRMRSDAGGMFSLWDEVGRMCLTRKVSALTAAIHRTANASDSFTPYEAAIVNSTAVESVTVHAAGCNSWITPHDGNWFKFEPHREFRHDSVATWLAECTESALLYLRGSNFYTRVHELYIDRVVSGTATLTAETGRTSPLNFRVFDPGSFLIADNEEGLADLLFRERQLTARQAEEKFGEHAPAKVRADAQSRPQTLHRFLQAVYPRPDSERRRPGSAGMPFGECWVSVDEKSKIAEAGFEEIPFFTNRYLRWSEFSPWGASPAMQALAEIRGVNFLDMLSCVAAETAVNPRIVLPQGFQGVPDLRAGGITMGGLTRDTWPQEWLTGGRFDIGENLVARKEQVIRSLFHVPLFEQFASIDRQITATEVRAREAEKVARFSPAFTQLTTELLNPLLQRVFMLLFRAGKFPPPPREALYQDAAGEWRMQYPQVVQTSRMALAIQALKQSALSDWLGLAMPLVQTGSQVLDNLDEDTAFRDLALGGGMPANYLRESEARDAMRAARAQAQQAAQQADMARELMKNQPLAEAGMAALQGA
jgi:hypothetical protein